MVAWPLIFFIYFISEKKFLFASFDICFSSFQTFTVFLITWKVVDLEINKKHWILHEYYILFLIHHFAILYTHNIKIAPNPTFKLLNFNFYTNNSVWRGEESVLVLSLLASRFSTSNIPEWESILWILYWCLKTHRSLNCTNYWYSFGKRIIHIIKSLKK